jgi:oligopeptide/dipeptide ABC transporter ATP-binding protein
MALLFITHDLGVIAEIADRVVVLYAGRIAETAPVGTLFDGARHPYTQALLAAIPKTTGPRDRLASIPGTVPALGGMPAGCRFAPRCPAHRPACDGAPPPLRALAADHSAACLAPFGFPPEGRAA